LSTHEPASISKKSLSVACCRTTIKLQTGRSSVWLERLHGVQEAAGSSPVAPILTCLPGGHDGESCTSAGLTIGSGCKTAYPAAGIGGRRQRLIAFSTVSAGGGRHLSVASPPASWALRTNPLSRSRRSHPRTSNRSQDRSPAHRCSSRGPPSVPDCAPPR
jgi:hypothetical protein